MVFRGTGIKCVSRECVPRCQQLEIITRYNPVKVGLLDTDRTVADNNCLEAPFDFVGNPPAMATAAIAPGLSRIFAVYTHKPVLAHCSFMRNGMPGQFSHLEDLC